MKNGLLSLLIGVGLIGGGLAMMYLDFRMREGQWIYVTSQRGELTPEDFAIWRSHGDLWVLVVLFAIGLPMTVYGILALRQEKRNSG